MSVSHIKAKERKPRRKDEKPYELTPRERTAGEAYVARKEQASPAPRMKVSKKNGITQIEPDHPEPVVGEILLMDALGTADPDFLNGLLTQLAKVGTIGGDVDERRLNFMLAAIKGLEPKDQVEAMLAAQMAAIHMATMTFARRLNDVENIPQQDSAERAFNKLARTFAVQVEALKRYRTGGEQRVTVKHVTVNEGGQAIVGAIQTTGGGYHQKSEDQPHAKQIAHAPQPAMPRANPQQDLVSVASDAERPLPDARRKIARRSGGK
jgi:hypothetical protein